MHKVRNYFGAVILAALAMACTPCTGVGTAERCYRIDATHDGVAELRADGHVVDYVAVRGDDHGTWYVDGIGREDATAEDAPVTICLAI